MERKIKKIIIAIIVILIVILFIYIVYKKVKKESIINMPAQNYNMTVDMIECSPLFLVLR